jgi:hypothetical protein
MNKALVLTAISLIAFTAGPAWAQLTTCALSERFVGSAAVSAPSLAQAILKFDFTPPDACDLDRPGRVRIQGTLTGQPAAGTTARAVRVPIDFAAPYVVDADGHLTIDAGSFVVEGEVGIAIDDYGCPECPKKANAFAFTAGPLGNPPAIFSGTALGANLNNPNAPQRVFNTCEECKAVCPGVCFLGPSWCGCYLEHIGTK